jgi:hypothetical protein
MAQSIPPVPSGTPPLYPNSPQHGTSPDSTAVSGTSNFGVGVSGESVGQPGVEGARPPSDGYSGKAGTVCMDCPSAKATVGCGEKTEAAAMGFQE